MTAVPADVVTGLDRVPSWSREIVTVEGAQVSALMKKRH